MQTGPPRKCCQISQKIEGVEPHPLPQLHASLGCPNRPCGGRGHAATEKKPPPPVWPASDLKKGMTSACTSRGASVRGRGPFHRGPHPQESEWGSCQALSTVLMDSAPPPSWVAVGGGTVELPAGWPDGYRGGPQTMQCLGRLACSAEVPHLPARFAVRGRPMLKSRLGPPISEPRLGISRG